MGVVAVFIAVCAVLTVRNGEKAYRNGLSRFDVVAIWSALCIWFVLSMLFGFLFVPMQDSTLTFIGEGFLMGLGAMAMMGAIYFFITVLFYAAYGFFVGHENQSDPKVEE